MEGCDYQVHLQLNSIHDGSIQLKDGQTILQGYQTYLKSTSKSLTLADLKTKALSASQIKGFGLKNKKYSINIIAYSDIHGVLLCSNIIWKDLIKLFVRNHSYNYYNATACPLSPLQIPQTLQLNQL